MTMLVRLLITSIVLIIVASTTNAWPWRHYSDDDDLKTGAVKEETARNLKTTGRTLKETQIFPSPLKIEKTVPKPDENKVLAHIVKTKGFFGQMPKVSYRDSEIRDKDETGAVEEKNKKRNHEAQVSLDDPKGTKSKQKSNENSRDFLLVDQDRVSSSSPSQPNDQDAYKLAYQQKKIALHARTDRNGEILSEKVLNSSRKQSSEDSFKAARVDTNTDALMHGKSQNMQQAGVEYVNKVTDTEEDYDEEEEESPERKEDKEEEKSSKREDEEEATGGFSSPGYDPVFSSFPRGVPPLYLPSSFPSSSRELDKSEETAEKDETSTEDRNETFIDVPYRYMPLPVVDPLGYALAYPWLSVKEIVDRVEDTFVLLNRKNNEGKGMGDSDRPLEELKTEIVEIEGKKYVLKTRSVKIGADEDTRAYVSLVSVTPYIEEEMEDKEKKNMEEERIQIFLNKKPEEEMVEKEIRKKETGSKKRDNSKQERKTKDLNDSDTN